MNFFIGSVLLGNKFSQDMNPDYIKIDNVAVGNSSKFSYIVINNKNIGELLQTALKDPKIVCIIYNWKSGVGYAKTGFNLSKDDYKLEPGHTTYIVKSKVSEFFKSPLPSVPSNFVIWNKSLKQFTLNGKKFVPVGFNAYWLGITEQFDYPSKECIEEMFIAAQKMSATVIRSHTLGASSGNKNSLKQSFNKINENAWDSIDYAFFMAKKYNIKLICPMVDCYQWYNGNYGDFTKDYNIDKKNFFTDSRCISDFKSYINVWLNHINKYTGIMNKNSPEIFAIENGNEFNYRPDSNSYTFPPYSWLKEISVFIKKQAPNLMLLHGTDEPLGKANEFTINEIDIFGAHFYGEDYERMSYGIKEAEKVGKPYITGEYSSRFGEEWYSNIETKVSGSMVWSFYYHTNGKPNGIRVYHEDGFTVWYDKQDPENTKLLLRMINHFKRMQNLPQITEIKL